MSVDITKYVQRQPSGIYRYYRRVPIEVSNHDKRTFVKTSLKTKNHKDALERAQSVHDATERLWAAMSSGNDNRPEWERYEAAVRTAQSLGFAYKMASDWAPLVDHAEFHSRMTTIEENYSTRPPVVVSVAGLAKYPNPRISDIWQMYEDFNQAAFVGMSPKQLEKHKVSRQRAVKYLGDLLKDVHLKDVSRTEVLSYRQWWTDKITKESLKAYSANRSFSDIKGMLSVIDDAMQTNFRAAWGDIRIKETNATKLEKRVPFSTSWVQDEILKEGILDGMNDDARFIVYTMVETGMRLGEVCNLRHEDIRVNDEVPHVEVADRADRRQKTEYSIRRIPLVGVALWAMKQAQGGFPRYADNADSASAAINKYLRSKKLCPTMRHTIYSLRHTFQDRIENADCSDRMQADLMGHEFGRPTYGDGAEMKRRQAFLESIKFVWKD
ncbi:DUF6538 domain-containing protein [Brucella pituitosa]|uniref:Tyrosine-type recombinase/integrase n=1 Tax=Brucella pituitosa TaxID=571256 RepID=A0ABS3K0M9_9HYPH|nr:DUF6538 domain-containing protein [Brucella pituitosa]MBO1040462.1 tyrosine-type recombinase/integrase [Brucella pituitosa]